MNKSTKLEVNTDWHSEPVSRAERCRRMGQNGVTLWFTGLSGAGKSTLAFSLDHRLLEAGKKSYVLDGDLLRDGLNSNLGFSAADREENIRRVGEVSLLAADAGLIVLSCFISPFRKDRRRVRELHKRNGIPFIEVYLDTSLELCEQRDSKQLYSKARRGEIDNFTGISSPYEVPEHPEIIVRATQSPVAAAEMVLAYLKSHDLIE